MMTKINLIFVGPPGGPINLSIASVTANTVTIQWLAPHDTGGRSDMHYVVNASNSIEPITTMDTHITLTDLQPLNTYTITITAENGVSNYSNLTANRKMTITINTAAGMCKFLYELLIKGHLFSRKSIKWPWSHRCCNSNITVKCILTVTCDNIDTLCIQEMEKQSFTLLASSADTIKTSYLFD